MVKEKGLCERSAGGIFVFIKLIMNGNKKQRQSEVATGAAARVIFWQQDKYFVKPWLSIPIKDVKNGGVMRLIIALLTLMAASSAFSAERSELCRRWYSYDIFQGYLRLAVTPPQVPETPSVMWIDMHIPYGIRPMPFLIKKIECGAGSIRIDAHFDGELPDARLEFVSDGSSTDLQKGRLTYISKSGEDLNTLIEECSVSAIQKFCQGR